MIPSEGSFTFPGKEVSPMWVSYNANPARNRVSDCTVRAISKLTSQSWDDVYWGLCIQGFLEKDMPSADNVWGDYLRKNGYRRRLIDPSCPDCYTVAQFCEDHPVGDFLLSIPGHVVAVSNSRWYDTFDSGDETPIYYYSKE